MFIDVSQYKWLYQNRCYTSHIHICDLTIHTKLDCFLKSSSAMSSVKSNHQYLKKLMQMDGGGATGWKYHQVAEARMKWMTFPCGALFEFHHPSRVWINLHFYDDGYEIFLENPPTPKKNHQNWTIPNCVVSPWFFFPLISPSTPTPITSPSLGGTLITENTILMSNNLSNQGTA